MNQQSQISLLHDLIEIQLLGNKKEVHLSAEELFNGLRTELIIPYQNIPEFCINPVHFSQLENAGKTLGVRVKNDDVYLNRLVDMEGVLLHSLARNYVLQALLSGVFIGIGLAIIVYILW